MTSEESLRELREWVLDQEIFTDPGLQLDCLDMAEYSGYKHAMEAVARKITEMLVEKKDGK